MAWIKPLLAGISACTTVALLTRTPLRPSMETECPSKVGLVIIAPIKPDEGTRPLTIW